MNRLVKDGSRVSFHNPLIIDENFLRENHSVKIDMDDIYDDSDAVSMEEETLDEEPSEDNYEDDSYDNDLSDDVDDLNDDYDDLTIIDEEELEEEEN